MEIHIVCVHLSDSLILLLLYIMSQDPRHLQYFADVNESNAYCLTQGKKLYSAPTEFGFCLKVSGMASFSFLLSKLFCLILLISILTLFYWILSASQDEKRHKRAKDFVQ